MPTVERSNGPRSLDLMAAKAAQDIINNTTQQKLQEVENLITKALGVLQENGVYAALLYLYSRKDKEKPIAEKTRTRLLTLINELKIPEVDFSTNDIGNASKALGTLTDKICNDLDRLLLVKQLWEQTLIYARYGAKAREAEEPKVTQMPNKGANS